MGVPRSARRLAAAIAAAALSTAVVLLSPAVAGAQDGEVTAPCNDRAEACVDLANNLAWLMHDGEVTYGPVPISHGKEGYETRPGTFDVDFKNKDHVSSIYDSPMPYSVFFDGGIAFHEGSLNSRSAGCVRMLHEDAKKFFDTLEPGDTVQVVSGIESAE